jgi:hypothetical protein
MTRSLAQAINYITEEISEALDKIERELGCEITFEIKEIKLKKHQPKPMNV